MKPFGDDTDYQECDSTPCNLGAAGVENELRSEARLHGGTYVPITEPVEEQIQDGGTIRFGKYSGQPWAELEMSYISFLVSDKCGIPEDLKKQARAEIERRRIIRGQLVLFKLG